MITLQSMITLHAEYDKTTQYDNTTKYDNTTEFDNNPDYIAFRFCWQFKIDNQTSYSELSRLSEATNL